MPSWDPADPGRAGARGVSKVRRGILPESESFSFAWPRQAGDGVELGDGSSGANDQHS